MRLSQIDLNLFIVFDAIYREGGITLASKRLHLSQSAVSHALARLRELVSDPLFERRGNDMVPTALARTLASTVASSLGELETVLHRLGHFDPATSRRRFTIALRAPQELQVLPRLVAEVARAAPLVELAAVRIDRRSVEEELASGEIDVALDVALPVGPEVRRERLSGEPLVVLARREHPAVHETLDLATYLALEHVLVTGRRRGGGYEDMALGRLGVTRRIRVRCQQHAAACEVVSRSDLLATMPRRHAQQVNRRTKNQVLPFPAKIPPMELYLYWHANAADDPAGQWLRALISEQLARTKSRASTAP